ncbi:MAG: hypothetical protein WC369_02110 [Dehalococcoidales bacterium]|jgi:hypothetical protein
MSTTVRENILEAIEALLKTITVANGYANTIANTERFKARGNSILLQPCIVVCAGPENKTPGPDPMTTCKLSVELDLWVRQEVTDTQDTDTILNSLLGDIEKALMSDHTLSGNCRDVTVLDILPFQTTEGNIQFGLIIELEVHYRHLRTDPTQAG